MTIYYLPYRLIEDLRRAGLGWLANVAEADLLDDADRALLGAFVAGKYHDDPRPSAQEIREMFPAPTPDH